MYRKDMDILLKIMIFPFTSIECYQNDLIGLLASEKDYKHYFQTYNQKVKPVLYNSLNLRYPIHSIDYIDLVMEKYYGYSMIKEKSSEELYLVMLSNFAKSFICHREGKLALKYWESKYDEHFIGPYKGINKIALWNTLNRMMCTDLIVISYLLDNNMEKDRYLGGFYSSIMLEDLQLEKILSKGVAETHIHRNAGINFSISWINLMNLSIKSESHYERLYLENPFYQTGDLKLVVSAMAILRLLMAHFLCCRQKSFLDYMEQLRESNVYEEKLIYQLIVDMCNGKVLSTSKIEFHNIKDCWEKLLLRLDIQMEEENDYIQFFLSNPEELHTTGENVFLFYAMKHMKQFKGDIFFRKLFFQYVKIRNVVFEAKVQDNSIKGLKYFQPNYKRSTKIVGYDTVSYWLMLMKTQFQNRHLRKLEFRFGFDGKKKSLKKIVISFLQAYNIFLEQWKETSDFQYKTVKPPQIGLVFHMIKRLDENWYDKCWKNTYELADNKDKQKELFYSENQQFYMKQIEVFNELRKEIPFLDKYLIGIDAASIEDNTEPWVFAPVYQKARNSSDACIQYESGKAIQTLGFTFHVGEDFRYILTGLRHVDEVLEHFAYHAGDRIGHGIVLGIDPQYWCEQNPIVMIPRGEYLDDLLWVWGVYKEKKGLEYLDISYLEQKIMLLAEEVFICIDGITVYMLWKMYQQKFEIFEPNRKFASDANTTQESRVFCKYTPENYKEYGRYWNYEALCYVQHCKCYSEKLLEPIQIEADSANINLFLFLQEMLVDKISNRGIIIETNPTSNLAIGEIKDLFHHYIFNLNDLQGKDKHRRAIISINSDDPSVFNTNVSNEISYIFYALQKQGYSREEALQWIDRIRNYGMTSSFLRDDQITVENLQSQIKFILEELRR